MGPVLRLSMSVAVVAAVCGSAWATARACSGDPCRAASVFPAGGQIPSDQLRLKFSRGHDARSAGAGDASMARLYLVSNGARTELELRRDPVTNDPASSILTPTTPVEPGSKLVLEAAHPECNGMSRLQSEFEVVGPAAKPASLGKLQVTRMHGPLQVSTQAGSCHVTIDAAYADLKIALSDAAKPFQDVIVYQLLLDGRPILPFSESLSGGVPLPRGQDRVYAPCSPQQHLSAPTSLGQHRVQLQGDLRDGSRISSDEVAFELACGSQAMANDAGTPPQAAGMMHTQSSAGGTSAAATAGTSAPATAGTSAPDLPERAGSSGCSVSSRGAAPRALLWLVAVAWFALLRRRGAAR